MPPAEQEAEEFFSANKHPTKENLLKLAQIAADLNGSPDTMLGKVLAELYEGIQFSHIVTDEIVWNEEHGTQANA